MKTTTMTNPFEKPGTYFLLLALLFLIGAGTAFALQSYGAQANTAGSSVHQVALKDGAAFPDELVIKVGEQVQFNSNDGRSHNISSGKGNDYGEEHDHVAYAAASGQFEADEAYLVSFPEPGTYYFHDGARVHA
jgi:plastocyanin